MKILDPRLFMHCSLVDSLIKKNKKKKDRKRNNKAQEKNLIHITKCIKIWNFHINLNDVICLHRRFSKILEITGKMLTNL